MLNRWIRRGSKSQASNPNALAQSLRCVVLEAEPNASSAYLLRPQLEAQGYKVETITAGEPPDESALRSGDFVVIVRYLTPAWRTALSRARPRLAGLAYFMDDDLLDRQAWRGLPRDYQRRLNERALRHATWLRMHCSDFWVSTAALADKYAELVPKVLPLAPPADLLAQSTPVRLAYHGTTSHMAEIEWLRPIVAQVLAACPQVQFELFADQAVYRLYRDLPRVTLLHPMRWPNYLAYTAASRCDIGLAPLLPSAFNAARGAVKFFDFARMGAAGLYTDTEPFHGFVRDGIDGLLLANDPSTWKESIIRLIGDVSRRQSLATAARQRALAAATSTAEPQ